MSCPPTWSVWMECPDLHEKRKKRLRRRRLSPPPLKRRKLLLPGDWKTGRTWKGPLLLRRTRTDRGLKNLRKKTR